MTDHVAVSKEPLPAHLTRFYAPLSAGGFALLVVAALLAFFGSSSLGVGWVTYYLHAYLTAYMFCFTISIGALFVVALQHLSRAGWSVSMRRLMELLMVAMIPMSVMFLPILASLWFPGGALFDWTNVEFQRDSHLALEKLKLLNGPVVTVVALICFAVWCGVAWFFWTNSRRQDDTHEIMLTSKMQAWSGPLIIAISFITTLAAFTFVMSLRPAWYSTMFGVYIFAGSMLALFATMDVGVFVIQRAGALRKEITIEHWHDLGKYTFGFIFFWAYITFSQFMLIWYANIPEETVWFFTRSQQGWTNVGLSLVILHWLVPFLGTMSRHVRRRPALMCFWGAWVLVMHYVDLYWNIMPEAGMIIRDPMTSATGGGIGLIVCLMTWVGMVGIYLGVVLWRAADVPAVAVGDPRLPESLAFENIS